jgi:hypothetical protein
MRFICANRDTVALIEDGARFSDFLVDWAATPIRFWWNSFARKVLEHVHVRRSCRVSAEGLSVAG